MADITWPSTGRAFVMARQDEATEWDVEISYARSGAVYTRALPGCRWSCTVHVPADTVSNLVERRQLEALLMSLRGGANRLLLWNLLTPAPLGSMRGAPVLSATAAAGATSVNVSGVPGTTLLRGDRIGIGGQRVMVVADAALNGMVTFEPQLRAAVSMGTAVVWDKPTSRYVLREPRNVFPVDGSRLPGFVFDLVEE